MAGKYIFPCPIPKSFHIIKSSKNKTKQNNLSSVSYMRLQYTMFSNPWSYFFLEWTLEEGVMLLGDEVLKKL